MTEERHPEDYAPTEMKAHFKEQNQGVVDECARCLGGQAVVDF